MESGRHGRGFSLLFVCTGNICRSPFAELLTAHFLVERLGPGVTSFRLGSAGVGAVVGSAMHPDTRAELAPWGLEGEYSGRFVARQLQPEMIQDADLILGATPDHRVAVLRLVPSALPKTFALREFARLAGSVDPAELPLEPVERAHALVERARVRRGAVRAAKPEDDSIIDPIGRNPKVHRQAAMHIAEAVQQITSIIAL